MAIKLVTIDIDDTLLNSKGEIMPTTHAAIKAAMAKGVQGCKLICGSSR
ncbi:HAD hydrolase family protein [Lacticaseibacillus pabuli]|uniref:HAD hydrolase family protein n=1 Tax=Lacticaseibacillus pabuli TaxID=3025672 RepID=A0ABY7WTP3_9LACO|nr:HAD hydrolase family protein [Lacticaseibacillus sp. KACC 23028]WDF82356.1 HAD hydrolase family protein [Lacticaseibacillus sp. KACC 23028]